MGGLKAFILIAASALAWPVSAQTPAIVCHDPLKPVLRAELFFGRDIRGHHVVNERQWARFLAHEVTPRFPDGLTAIDGRGQSHNADGVVAMREPTKIVVIVTEDAGGVRARIAAVVAAYKEQFDQSSVGVVLQPVCAAF